MASSESKFRNRPIAWVLPGEHQSLRMESLELNLKAYRMRSNHERNPVSLRISPIIDSDWRRAEQIASESYPEYLISSIIDLPSFVGDVPVIVSGSRALAESLYQQLKRKTAPTKMGTA